MSLVYAFTVTRANTPERAKLLLNTISEARKTAAHPFHWMMIGQTGTLAEQIILNAFKAELIDSYVMNPDNVGQHHAWNTAIEDARSVKADYFLRLDDDVEFVTKRWLKRLVELSAVVEDKMIISPVVKGLQNPPPRSNPTDVKGYQLEFLTEAIGGICRFHPLALLDHPTHPFVADVRKPLGAGDATTMGAWCLANIIPMVYARHIRVKHALTTEGQYVNDPIHHSTHDLCMHIPYIPTWTRQTA